MFKAAQGTARMMGRSRPGATEARPAVPLHARYRRRPRQPAHLLLLLLLLGTGEAAAIMGGAPDTDARFAAVVLVLTGEGFCTATKIGPQHLLTAAHCTLDTASSALHPPFTAGGRLHISNALHPQGSADLRPVRVRRTQIAPAFRAGLKRLQAFKRERIAALRAQIDDPGLVQRLRGRGADHHFTARFPDAAVIELDTPTPAVPTLGIDLGPLAPDERVTLVGYGCADAQAAPDGPGDGPRPGALGTRRFAASRVIRADGVNLYSYARHLRTGAPSLCPGDSGGPVLRAGRVVGVHSSVHGYGGHAGRRGGHSNRAVRLRALRDWDLLAARAGGGE
jgi:hypothetical protein